jgi:hypothetical protein
MAWHDSAAFAVKPRALADAFYASTSSWKVVVARYAEDLSWLRMFRGEEVEIINKGAVLPWVGVGWKVAELMNVGREAHSYLWWIVENYDRLPDVVFFTQGQVVDCLGPKWTPFSRKGSEIGRLLGDSGSNWLEVMIRYFYYRCKAADSPGWICDTWSPEGLEANLGTGGRLAEYKGGLEPADRGMREFFRELVDVEGVVSDDEYMRVGRIYWNALFAVRKERILLRPRSYYERLLNWSSLTAGSSVEAAHFYERAWYYIFGCHLPLDVKKCDK